MITIPQSIVSEIEKQAVAEAPNEACGYLAGLDGSVSERIRMTNVDQSPEHFSLDPSEQFDAVKKARASGLNLIAVYHSHPETPARMSDEDIRLANDPQMIYVIFSLKDKNAKAFRITADKLVDEIELSVV